MEKGKLIIENENLKKKIMELEIENKALKIAMEYIGNNKKEKVALQEPKRKEKNDINDLISFKAKLNKKEMIKEKMLSIITEDGINLSELKYLFVEHYKYSSKATFYNYLKELEIENIIKVQRIKTKNYVFINQEDLITQEDNNLLN